MAEISGELVGRIVRDCGVSENEATRRLLRVVLRKGRKVHKRSPRMSAWGVEWHSSDLEELSGIPIKTLLVRWNKGIRYPDLIKRMLRGGKKTAEELEEMAVTKNAVACRKLLDLLREHHPELEMVEDDEGDQTHTASGVINGSRFRNAAFAGVRQQGMETI